MFVYTTNLELHGCNKYIPEEFLFTGKCRLNGHAPRLKIISPSTVFSS